MMKHLIAFLTLCFGYQTTYCQSSIKDKIFLEANIGITSRIEGEQTQSQFHRKTTQTVKNGTQYGITAFYDKEIIPSTILGLKYLLNTYEGENNTSVFLIDGQPAETGILKNNSKLHFIALSSRSSFQFGNGKNEAYCEPSVGYFLYKQEIQINTKQTLKGGNIGFSINFGYLRNLSKNLSIGANFGFFNANLENYTVDNGISKQKIEAAPVDAIVLSSLHSNLILRYKL
ncbi:hypothetical protein [Wenyingzhuangia sp. IMCC45574]